MFLLRPHDPKVMILKHYKMFQLYKLLGILSEMKCADSETSKIIVSKMPFQLVKNITVDDQNCKLKAGWTNQHCS